MKRRVPGWRYHPTPVFRDVQPGRMPLPIDTDDGEPWMTIDMEVEMIDAVERLAKKRRCRFVTMMGRILESGIREKFRDWRGF